jgi:hypothetical protein
MSDQGTGTSTGADPAEPAPGSSSDPATVDGRSPAAEAPPIEPEGVARSEELAEVLNVARDWKDGSLLLRTLARASVFIPLPPEMGGDEPGERQVEPGTELPLPVIENEGNRFVVAFSSEERMAEWFGGADFPVWHEALMVDLLPTWPPNAGLALDTSSEGGILLPGHVVERIRLLTRGEPIEEAYDLGPATRFRAGTPVEAPEDVLEALRTAAAQHPQVKRVTMLLVQIDEPGGRTWPVVGVLVEEGADVDGPMSALVEAVQSVTEEFVTFSPLPATEGTEFEQILRDDGLVVV